MWCETPVVPYDDEKAWVHVLVPDTEIELLIDLRNRTPFWLLSSTYVENPWMRVAQ